MSPKRSTSIRLQNGYYIHDQFLSTQCCEKLLENINQFRESHTLSEIHREMPGRSLHYSVIDGEAIARHLPVLLDVSNEVKHFLSEQLNLPELELISNKKVNINVNITPKGGQYRWHYDRNAITVLLYLNTVQGGVLEFYPNYRLYLRGWSHTVLQKWLDYLLGTTLLRTFSRKRRTVAPVEGRMVIIQANCCLHSVQPVIGDTERINVVLAFDQPMAQFPGEKQLDTYIYTQTEVSADPNYQTRS